MSSMKFVSFQVGEFAVNLHLFGRTNVPFGDVFISWNGVTDDELLERSIHLQDVAFHLVSASFMESSSVTVWLFVFFLFREIASFVGKRPNLQFHAHLSRYVESSYFFYSSFKFFFLRYHKAGSAWILYYSSLDFATHQYIFCHTLIWKENSKMRNSGIAGT